MQGEEVTTTGLTRRIAEFAGALRWEDLPEPVRHRARIHLVDTLGAIIAGMSGTVAGHVGRLAAGSGGMLPLPGGGGRAPVAGSGFALICGTAGHGIELDDGYRQGTVHPGVAVVPALLAASWETPTDGRRLLTALVAGYEVICGLAAAAHPALRRNGYHPTPAVGALGAAVAVSRLMQADARQIETALGIGASACGGLFAFLSGGADVKRLHGGLAARGGYEAAQLALAGVSAPAAVIEGPSGWAGAFAGQPVEVALPPARPFRILDCYLKPHACCRHLQPAFEAVTALMSQHELTPADVQAIHVETYGISAHHAHVGWDSFADAQLSFPYLIYLALHHGDAGLARFDAATRADPAIAAVAGRLSVVASDALDRRYPAERPCRVTLKTGRGQFHSEQSEAAGGPELPLSDAEVRAKFLGLTAPVLGAERATKLFDFTMTIEQSGDASEVLDLAALP